MLFGSFRIAFHGKVFRRFQGISKPPLGMSVTEHLLSSSFLLKKCHKCRGWIMKRKKFFLKGGGGARAWRMVLTFAQHQILSYDHFVATFTSTSHGSNYYILLFWLPWCLINTVQSCCGTPLIQPRMSELVPPRFCSLLRVQLFIIPLLHHFTKLGHWYTHNIQLYYSLEQGENTEG